MPAARSGKALRAHVLQGMRAGRPATGPLSVHVDITNSCNARCLSCWDHSPLLREPRDQSWKRRRLPLPRFEALLDQLVPFRSLQEIVLSGMGEPLTHPQVYAMIRAVKARGWRLTLITNLVAAQLSQLLSSGVDRLLVGVHGVHPDSYAAFHPGWSEREFFKLCRALRAVQRAGIEARHVQVICRHNAGEVEAMLRFGSSFGAQRVSFKLASLRDGTEACAATPRQLAQLRESLPAARQLALQLGVPTNLQRFEEQLEAGGGRAAITTPMHRVGCSMGYVYARVTVAEEVLFCCDTQLRVGSLEQAEFEALWQGQAWQRWRERLADGQLPAGCSICGKYEQNLSWRERLDAARDL